MCELFFLQLDSERNNCVLEAKNDPFSPFRCMAVPFCFLSKDAHFKITQHIFFRRQLSRDLTLQITRRMRAISPCGSRARAHLRSTDDLKDRESNTIRKRIKNWVEIHARFFSQLNLEKNNWKYLKFLCEKNDIFCTRVPFSPFHLYGRTAFYHFKRSAVLEYTTYFFSKATFRGPDPLNYTSYARRTTPPQCSARTCARLTTGRVVSSASINHDALVNMFATLFYHLFLKWLVRKAAQKFSFVFRYVCVTEICLTIYTSR